jgi:DNA-binding MarR family transcriptional regulator
MSVMDLSFKANVNKGQASRAAQILVDRGFIRKAENPNDGRGVELTLTAEGQELWAKTMKLIEARNQEIFGCLNKEELAQLSGFLDRLVAHNVKT